jgi:hypothetical protein
MRVDEEPKDFEYLRQDDPIKQVALDSPRLASSWLKDGNNLTTFQRLGHATISIAYICAGVFCAGGAKLNFQDGTVFMALLFSLAALFFVFFGAKGLQNILRFKKRG